MIQLFGVTKKYKMGDEHIYALNDVDLEIERGEFVAVMGPSGSGKSTLANIIGGLDTPDAGRIVVDGQDLSKMRDNELSSYRNKRIGFIFQTFNLHPNYTALENVSVPLIFAKVSPRERKKIAKKCLELVGLTNRAKHKPSELSGGQRQRVSIARALVNNPEIIIADEPTGNLDSQKGKEIIELLEYLNKERITLIVITHDPNVARKAKRIIELHDGKIK